MTMYPQRRQASHLVQLADERGCQWVVLESGSNTKSARRVMCDDHGRSIKGNLQLLTEPVASSSVHQDGQLGRKKPVRSSNQREVVDGASCRIHRFALSSGIEGEVCPKSGAHKAYATDHRAALAQKMHPCLACALRQFKIYTVEVTSVQLVVSANVHHWNTRILVMGHPASSNVNVTGQNQNIAHDRRDALVVQLRSETSAVLKVQVRQYLNFQGQAFKIWRCPRVTQGVFRPTSGPEIGLFWRCRDTRTPRDIKTRRHLPSSRHLVD